MKNKGALYPCAIRWCSGMSHEERGFCAVHREDAGYRPEDCDAKREPQCRWCDGDGECHKCDGEGKCEHCHQECEECYGTKNCRWCRGSGIEIERKRA